MPRGVPLKGWKGGYHTRRSIAASVSPTVADLHWAAGLVEGEAGFRRRGDSEIRVLMVDDEPLRKLLRLFGGAVHQNIRRPTTPKQHTRYWVWAAYGARARGIVMTLYSLLSKRRQEQIRTVLAA